MRLPTCKQQRAQPCRYRATHTLDSDDRDGMGTPPAARAAPTACTSPLSTWECAERSSTVRREGEPSRDAFTVIACADISSLSAVVVKCTWPREDCRVGVGGVSRTADGWRANFSSLPRWGCGDAIFYACSDERPDYVVDGRTSPMRLRE